MLHETIGRSSRPRDMRRVLTAVFRLLLRVFFRRIEITGLGNVPAGPVIFAVNHPNGLVDPLFILCFAPREVSFLAKAPLFGYPVIGWFVRKFGSIPVYRKEDAVAGSNRETFRIARECLARGGGIAIFPEGTSHSDSRLREFRSGAARIALGSGTPLAIVPAAIYYTEKQTFRSAALVSFGAPIGVEPATLDAEGEPPAEAVEALTGAIERELGEMTLQADSHEALDLVVRAERIFSADDQDPLAGELELRRRFAAGYHALKSRDPQRLARIASRITRIESELEAAGLDPERLVARRSVSLRAIAAVVVLLPAALAGAVVHHPAYRLVAILARRFSRGADEMTATVKFLASLLLYPLTWIAVAGVAAWGVGAWLAVPLLVAMPLLGYAAVYVAETLDELVGRVRAAFARHTRAQLLEERRAIRREIAAIAEEIGA